MSLDIAVIKGSFEDVKPVAPKAVAKFYEVLFADYPAAKGLFEGVKMEPQKKALINSLVFIVDHLEDSAALKDYLFKLGGRHFNYGVEPEHYDWVGASLLKALGLLFGSAWTKELHEQWTYALTAIKGMMLEGQAAARASQPTPRDRAAQICRALLLEVLDTELDDQIVAAARQKIRQTLMDCLEEESERLLKKGA